jgi:hypothetical protein
MVAEAETRLASRGATRVQAIVVQTGQRATGCWRATTWTAQAERLRFTAG